MQRLELYLPVALPDPLPPLSRNCRGVEEGLCEGATIHMHLLIGFAVQSPVEHGRRESARHRGRGEQHATDRVQRFWVSAPGNRPDVPDYRLLCVEVGG